jgi:hypothetical protein
MIGACERGSVQRGVCNLSVNTQFPQPLPRTGSAPWWRPLGGGTAHARQSRGAGRGRQIAGRPPRAVPTRRRRFPRVKYEQLTPTARNRPGRPRLSRQFYTGRHWRSSVELVTDRRSMTPVDSATQSVFNGKHFSGGGPWCGQSVSGSALSGL